MSLVTTWICAGNREGCSLRRGCFTPLQPPCLGQCCFVSRPRCSLLPMRSRRVLGSHSSHGCGVRSRLSPSRAALCSSQRCGASGFSVVAKRCPGHHPPPQLGAGEVPELGSEAHHGARLGYGASPHLEEWGRAHPSCSSWEPGLVGAAGLCLQQCCVVLRMVSGTGVRNLEQFF